MHPFTWRRVGECGGSSSRRGSEGSVCKLPVASIMFMFAWAEMARISEYISVFEVRYLSCLSSKFEEIALHIISEPLTREREGDDTLDFRVHLLSREGSGVCHMLCK